MFSLFLKAVRKARSAVHLACFYSVHREEASNQGLVRLRPNYSWRTEGIPQPKFRRKEERKRKCNLQHGQTFCHPIYPKDIPSFSEVPLHFHKWVWFNFWELASPGSYERDCWLNIYRCIAKYWRLYEMYLVSVTLLNERQYIPKSDSMQATTIFYWRVNWLPYLVISGLQLF